MMRVKLLGGAADGIVVDIGSPYTPDTLNVAQVMGAWQVIGTNRIPPGIPLSNSHLLYRLDRDASDLRPHPRYAGMEVGEASYRWVA